MNDKMEIRLTGFGGQGVVLAGMIIGRAYSVEGGKQATLMQSFGPEARGSACAATLSLAETEVLYPYVRLPDILVAMSGEGYEMYKKDLKQGGILIHEKDLVSPTPRADERVLAVPSTRIAEQLGKKILQNIVLVGFFTAAVPLIDREKMRAAVKAMVPAGTEEMNLKAFDAGWKYYEDNYGKAKTVVTA